MAKEKFTITEEDYIKAVRKADREREIEMHGKVISIKPPKTHKSKKAYDRKKNKRIIDDISRFEHFH